jgi:predicted outer membrane repeat protein
MYNDSGDPTVIRCTFISNSASFDGGGMYNNNSNPVINNCIFNGNYVSSEGAGIKNVQSSPVLSLCTFTNNIGLLGGGMSNQQSSPAIAHSIFSGNYSEEEGGGIYNTDDSNPLIINCIFSRNHAAGSLNWQGGGGICNHSSGSQVINCTFIDNSGNVGGGMKCDDSNSIMINCIFWNNSASDGNEIAVCNNSSIDISYCDVEGGITNVHIESGCVLNWGNGNINSDPCFADVINGDYHLKSAVGRWNPLYYTNGDFNNDGIINVLDLERFVLYWLSSGQGIVVDLYYDEFVGFEDYAILVSNWHKLGHNTCEWVLDSVTSPCIDAGDPDYDYTNEPVPNGGRINMGAYGNTKQASMGTQ